MPSRSPNLDRRSFLAGSLALGSAALSSRPAGGDDKPDRAAAQREHAHKLHRESVVIVVHDHNPIEPDLEKMLAGGVTAKVFQIGVDVDINGDFLASAPVRNNWSRRALATLDEVDRIAARNSDKLLLARTAADIVRAKRSGKVAIMLGVEGAKLLDGDVRTLDMFYKRGLRELQLRWGVPNQIVEKEDLTDFGRQVVQACNQLGIIISLTHIPAPAYAQVLELTKKPPIICHGAASRRPEDGPDMRGDRQLRALRDKGGVLSIHFYAAYLGSRPNVERVVDQVDYIAQVAGIDTVALGVDMFPTTGNWADFQRAQRSTQEIAWAIPDLSQFMDVTEALVMRGYSDGDVKKVLGENFLRVCRANFGS